MLIANPIYDSVFKFLMENLTHDSYVVQIPSLPPEGRSKLDKILSFFNQKYIFDEGNKWLLRYQDEVDDEDQKLILKRLAYAAESDTVKHQIEVEETFDADMDLAIHKLMEKKEAELMGKMEELQQKDTELQQKEAALQQAQALAEKEKREKEDLLARLEALEKQQKKD